MAQLTMAFESASLINDMNESRDDDWPSGVAHKVVKKLFEEYQPKDRIAEVEFLYELGQVKMTKKEDPKELFSKLATLEITYNSDKFQVVKSQLIAVVLSKAPKEYATGLATESRIKGNSLAMLDL